MKTIELLAHPPNLEAVLAAAQEEAGVLLRLGPQAKRLCFDPAIRLVLSVASVWEMQIKVMLGKSRYVTGVASFREQVR